ncbi:MAG TPA: hypothetical protein VHF89_11760 [Solirubrobacteraceae bacterium]|nr:hypothetical protein [Solirubrobacteraceae bacterium]
MNDRSSVWRNAARHPLLVAIVAAVVGGAFTIGAALVSREAGGPDIVPAKTVTRTVTQAETVEVCGENCPSNGGSSTRSEACAPVQSMASGDAEPNNSEGTASGPITSAGVDGTISTINDTDYFAVCIAAPVEVTPELSCRSNDQEKCDAVYAMFGTPDEWSGGGGYFDTSSSLSCSVPRAGRYFVRVDANTYPVAYTVSISASDASSIVEELPEGTPPVDVDACGD